MSTRRRLAVFCWLTLLSLPIAVQAVPIGFTYTQTDATTGSGTITGTIDTFLMGGPGPLSFSGALPAATVTQNDTNTGFPVPAGVVGFITTQDDGNPGGSRGVHIGFSGTVTISAADASGVWQMDVPLTLRSGDPYSYDFTVFDDLAAGDVTGNPQFAGWPGDNGAGHRHTDGRRTFDSGTSNTHSVTASGSLGGNANGDALGFTAGIRDTPNGPLFVDQITFGGALDADADTLTLNGSPVPAPGVPYTLLDIGPSGQRVETVFGAAIAIGTAGNGNNGPEFPPTSFTSDTGDSFTVAIDDTNTSGNDQGRIDWRDRGDSSNGGQALVKLGEDFIKNNSGIIRLTLGGLEPGLYIATSYHIDPNYDQSGQIQVWVDNGMGFENTGAVGNSDINIGGVNNLTTAVVEGTSALFGFVANGINDVAIVFNGRPHSDDETPLNGLLLRQSTAAHLWINPGTGDWNTGSNWLAGTVPGPNDVARIDNGGTAQIGAPVSDIDRLIIGSGVGASGALEIHTGGSLTTLGSDYCYVGANGTGVLTIESGATLALNDRLILGGGSSGLGTINTAGTLSNPGSYLAVGDDGTGVFNQTGGTVTVEDLRLGYHSGTGTYTMGGASTLTVNDDAYIGDNGTGIFTQAGGYVRIENDLQFGRNPGSHGTFNIAGGTMDATDSLHVGLDGTGIVNQTGGTVQVDDNLYVAYGGASNGQYTMSGAGSLLDVVDDMIVGDSGDGSMAQTGGVVQVGSGGGDDLIIGNNTNSVGSYSLSGAGSQLNVYNRISVGNNGDGTFTMTGGTVQAQDFFLADSDNGSGTATISGGTLTFTDDVHIGDQGPGDMTQSGGSTVSIAGELWIGNQGGRVGNYDISGAGTQVTVGAETHVGHDGTGTLSLSDGAVMTLSNRLYIGRNGSASGTVTISGAATQLTTNNHLAVGDNGTGLFTMNDGMVQCQNLRVGYHNGQGDYNMSGGALNISEDAFIGDNGTATFDQTGGTLAVNRDFQVGRWGSAVYALSGAGSQINVGRDMDVGYDGTGQFTQTGGAVTVSDDLLVGRSGTGHFNQSGGSVVVNDYLNLAEEGSGAGTYTLGGGTVNTRTLGVGVRGTGTFTQNGGTVTTTGSDSDLRIGREGSGVGTYNLVNGTLDIFDDIYVGFHGTGTFTQDAGTIDSKTMLVGRYSDGEGDVVQNGGTWTTRLDASIGIEGRGTYTQNGGTVNVGDEFFLGQNSGGDGTYTLNAGALNVPNDHLYVSRAGGSTGTFIQNGGDVVVGSALRMATDSPNTTAHYEIHDGTVTVGQYVQVGRRGVATLIQTGGTITANRGSLDAFTIGDKSDGRGTFETRGGVVNVPNALLTVGRAGIAMLDILGSNTDINANQYYQNNRSTLRAAIHNEGISRINVASNATVSSGAMLDVDIWGGVLFAGPGSTYEIMRTATAGNISGTFSVIDPEPIWSVIQDGTIVAATVVPTLPAATLHPSGWFEVTIGGGAGSVTDMLPIQGLIPGEETWLAIDLVDLLGNDLTPAQVADLADQMIEAGQDPQLSGWVLDANPDYDMYFEGPAPGSQLYFGWDFSDYDPNVAIARVRAGIPEPTTMVLLGLGALGFAARRRRRR